MSQKDGKMDGYPQGPPPPYQPYPNPSFGNTYPSPYPVAGGATFVVTPGPAQTTIVHRPQRGFIGSIVHEVNMFGHSIGREINSVGKEIGVIMPGNQIFQQFQSGNIIQLISRASGRSLEILMGPNGQLVIDGNGPVDPSAFHTQWTVINEGLNQVRLHNNHNYLAIVNGHTILVHMPPGTMHGIETKFQLSVISNFVLLESLKERNHHVGILPSGQLKPALACGREDHAHFGVQLVSSPYPRTSTTVQTVTVVKK